MEGGMITKRKITELNGLEKILQKNKYKKVILSGGEPLLNPNLLLYIKLCKEYEVKDIGLVTAWEDGFDQSFAKKILLAGVNEIMLSIEGPRDIHDKLTQKKGSYFNIARAFRWFYQFKSIFDFKLIIHSNINKINYKVLPIFVCKFLEKYPNIDYYHLQTLEPLGNVLRFGKKILPQYIEIVDSFSDYFEIFLIKYKNKIKFDLWPYCVINKKYFPLLGLRTGAILYESNSELLDSLNLENKLKFDRCKKCRLNSLCDGVWENYVNIYGDQEFNPI